MLTELADIATKLFPLVGALFSFVFMSIILYVLLRSLRGANIRSLFTSVGDPESFSNTKFWQNVAYAASTVAFLGLNLTGGTDSVPLEMIWVIYLGVVASNAVLSKWISAKYNGPVTPEYRRRRNQEDWQYDDYYDDCDDYGWNHGRRRVRMKDQDNRVDEPDGID